MNRHHRNFQHTECGWQSGYRSFPDSRSIQKVMPNRGDRDNLPILLDRPSVNAGVLDLPSMDFVEVGARLAPDDEIAIGRAGDVYNEAAGERIGTLTNPTLGTEQSKRRITRVATESKFKI